MLLREVINVRQVCDESSVSELEEDEEDEENCRLMLQCLQDPHPSYLIIACKSEMVRYHSPYHNPSQTILSFFCSPLLIL